MSVIRLVILGFLVSCSLIGIAQDSLIVSGEVALLGRRQTGNLDQLGLNPSARLSLQKNAYSVEVSGNYQFLEVNYFRSINDLWINGLLKIKPTERVYPFAIAYYGFADSYRIDESLVAGVGAGINVFEHSLKKFLQVHLHGGYASLDFQEALSQSSPIVGSLIKARVPIDQGKLSLLWEFHSYHSLEDKQFEGVNNILQIRFSVFKGLHLNVSHTTIFNNTVNEGIAKTNTLMMFGLAYAFNKNL